MANNQTGVAMTVADMAASAQSMSKYIRGSLTLLEHEYELSDILKFINLGGQQSATVPRPNPDALGTVLYRNVDGKYTRTKSSTEKFTEETKLLAYMLEIDTVTSNDPSFSLFKPGPYQQEILAGQWARELMDCMVNGDPTVDLATNDPDGFALRRPPGLRYRLANQFNGIDANCKINSTQYGGSAFDLTAITTTIANNLVDAINETIDLVDADVMLMNYRTKTLLKRAQRVGGMLQTTKDTYDRSLDMWRDTKIIVPKLKTGARTERNTTDTTNWILPYESATGTTTPTASAGSQFASIFFLNTSSKTGFTGLTVNGVQQRGPEKLPLPAESVGYSMQYGFGFATLGLRTIAQLYNMKIG